MKLFSAFILGLLFVLTASSSLAGEHTTYVNGYGYASGYCQANSSYFCVNDLERRAEYDAQYDAERQCRYQNGQLVSTFGCSTNCNPYYIPPNSPGTWVNCNTNCNLPCRIQDEE